jgi:hypothetical protein
MLIGDQPLSAYMIETGPSRGRVSYHVDPGHHQKESTTPEPHAQRIDGPVRNSVAEDFRGESPDSHIRLTWIPSDGACRGMRANAMISKVHQPGDRFVGGLSG